MHFGSQAGAQSSDLSLLVTRRDQKPWKQIPIDHQQVKKLDSKGGSARSTLFSLPVSSLLLSQLSSSVCNNLIYIFPLNTSQLSSLLLSSQYQSTLFLKKGRNTHTGPPHSSRKEHPLIKAGAPTHQLSKAGAPTHQLSKAGAPKYTLFEEPSNSHLTPFSMEVFLI